MGNYDNFVFYGSWRESLEGFREDFGDEYAVWALWNLMTAATGGDIETDKKSIINWISGSCMPNIKAAKERYTFSIENGKKGGRPSKIKEEDNNKIFELKKEGKTQLEIANLLGVSQSTIKRSEGWNRTLSSEQVKMDQKGQNPDKEKDIDKEKEKEKLEPSSQFSRVVTIKSRH